MSSAADLVQPAAIGGWDSNGLSSGPISLGSPTQDKSTLLLVGQSGVSPALWTIPGFSQVGPNIGVGASNVAFLIRPDVPAGEQAYTFNTQATGQANCVLFEFARMDTISPFDQYSAGATTTTDTVSTGTTPTTSVDDEIIIAAFVAQALPGASFAVDGSGGFASYATAGPRSISPSLLLDVSLLFATATGQFACSATVSPSGSGATIGGIAVCLRAVGELLVPSGQTVVTG